MQTNHITPVMIIGGYLGAGKTTLVNHLLRNADGRRLAIMVNEFGDLSIDADLIEMEGDDLISLAGGCVCCSYGSGLMEAFVALQAMEPKPDHIVLEASGVAIPSSIAGSVALLDGFSLAGVICLVDAMQIHEQAGDKYLQDTIERQLAETDLILLNKTDGVSEVAVDEIRAWLGTKSKNAPVVPTRHAAIAPQILLQGFDREETTVSAAKISHLDGFSSQVLEDVECVEAEDFANNLLRQYPAMVRGKGFVAEADGTLKTIQIVGRHVDISDAPKGAKPGMVIISQEK